MQSRFGVYISMDFSYFNKLVQPSQLIPEYFHHLSHNKHCPLTWALAAASLPAACMDLITLDVPHEKSHVCGLHTGLLLLSVVCSGCTLSLCQRFVPPG